MTVSKGRKKLPEGASSVGKGGETMVKRTREEKL